MDDCTSNLIQSAPDDTLASIITLGRHGSFPVSAIIGRPFHATFEILDEVEWNGAENGPVSTKSPLRMLSAAEVQAETIAAQDSTPDDQISQDTSVILRGEDGLDYEVSQSADQSTPLISTRKTNRNTFDSSSHQTLSASEIQVLKTGGRDGGRELIAKLMASHSALDQKTAFSLAKYAVRKQKKFLRRFTVLPIDVGLLCGWILESKEPMKIMEVREEMLGLMTCWANVHYTPQSHEGGRWLVVDDTGGLIVAATAEKMGILYPPPDADTYGAPAPPTSEPRSNIITLVHAATQPNLSLLRYFGHDTSSPQPSPAHPLHSHLRTITLLQLVDPSADSTCAAEPVSVDDLSHEGLTSPRRAKLVRKRKRWEGVMGDVADTRAGGFDGLLVASYMEPVGLLRLLLPLLHGGAKIVIYSPHVERLTELVDLFSTARRNAFLRARKTRDERTAEGSALEDCEEDFPLDPREVLRPELQTSRVRKWQCLPGRTHPLMTAKGGAEGYLFTGVKVLPLEGEVMARGTFIKKKTAVADS